MALASFQFLLLFLPIVLLGAYQLRRFASVRVVQAWLLLSSVVFYVVGSPRDLPVLAASILLNWFIARAISSRPTGSAARKRWLVAGIVLNVSALGTFKYLGFVATTLNTVAHLNLPVPTFHFPAGISFFSLSQLMYLVDCYEGLVPPSSLFDHATFATFFPYVTMGPLCRVKPFLRQISGVAAPGEGTRNIARGILLVSLGLSKKVLLADAFARLADAGFGHVSSLSTVEVSLTSVAYTMQLYFDFSGYSDMAVGAAMMLGIVIPRNFDSPLRATSVVDFWRRWHISLSMFITTYLYTPMVRGTRKVTVHVAALATLAAMTIAGLWHGPSWHFVVFGILHGVGLATNQYWKRLKRPLPTVVARSLTFVFVVMAFMVFRASDLPTAWQMFCRFLPGAQPWGAPVLGAYVVREEGLGYAILLILAAGIAFRKQNSGHLLDLLLPAHGDSAAAATTQPVRAGVASAYAVTVGALLFLSLVFLAQKRQFLYFQF